jgi:DNA-binding transcriptional ArsR family regulator
VSPRKNAPNSEHLHPVDPERVTAAQARVLPAEEATRLASLLTLMADPVRSRILYALDVVEELCGGDLALVLGTTEDAVSYGLRILRTAGLVQARKEGRFFFYRLATDFPEPLLEHCLRQLVLLSRAVQELEPEDSR